MSVINTHVEYFDRYAEGQTDVYNIRWLIFNFDDFLRNNTTTTFITKKNQNPSRFCFQLKISVIGKSNDLFELYYLSPVTAFIKLTLNVRIREHESFGEMKLFTNEFHTVKAHTWKYIMGISKYQLQTNNNMYYTDDTFYLTYKFKVAKNVTVRLSGEPKKNLGKNLEYLLNSGFYSDVIIKSIRGTPHRAHKNILSCRSAVLKAHFEHNSVEIDSSMIESQFDDDVLEQVIIYFYTDTYPKLEDMPEKLLEVADYYQVQELKRACEKMLYSKLTIENAPVTLLLADLHSAGHLKQLTLDFMRSVPINLLKRTEAWAQFMTDVQINAIYEYIVVTNDFALEYI